MFRSDEEVPDEWHETILRVRYSETDKMGVVYHANNLIWFEIGRTEFCRARGFAYRDMEESENAFLVVAEVYCRYKAPAYYDGVVIAEGETGHVVTDANGRVRSLPPAFAELLLSPPMGSEGTEGETVPEISPE